MLSLRISALVWGCSRVIYLFRVKHLQPGSATSPFGWPYYRITVCFQDLNLNYVFPDSRKSVLKRNQVASTVKKCPARLPIVEFVEVFRSQDQAVSRLSAQPFGSACFFKWSCTIEFDHRHAGDHFPRKHEIENHGAIGQFAV